jgi:hypothetical protein
LNSRRHSTIEVLQSSYVFANLALMPADFLKFSGMLIHGCAGLKMPACLPRLACCALDLDDVQPSTSKVSFGFNPL